MHQRTLMAFFILALIACKGKKEEANAKSNRDQATVVDVVIAGTQPVSNIIEVNGSVIANESVQVFPEINGRLTYLNIPDGATVQAGTVLARINDADLQAQLLKSKSQLTLAKATEERLRKLVAIKGINQADYDAAQNNVNNINADIELLNAQIAKSVIRAPFSGTLGLRQVSPGAYVTPQTLLVTLQKTDRLKIDFTVPESNAGLIKKGVTLPIASSQDTLKRTATIIATEADINTTTRNLKVRALVNGPAVSPGAFVKVLLDAGSTNNSIVIPSSAIIPDADSKKIIVVKGGKGAFVNVETGVRTASGVEITKGIKAGDSVVVTGVLFVRPNAPVKVRSVKQLKDIKE